MRKLINSEIKVVSGGTTTQPSGGGKSKKTISGPVRCACQGTPIHIRSSPDNTPVIRDTNDPKKELFKLK